LPIQLIATLLTIQTTVLTKPNLLPSVLAGTIGDTGGYRRGCDRIHQYSESYVNYFV
jgi:hypothetical protein